MPSKKLKRARFVIQNPVFPFPVAVAIGPYSHRELEAYAKKIGAIRKEEALHETSYTSGGGCWSLDAGAMIWLAQLQKTPDSLSMLVHETTHATNHIGQLAGFVLSNESCEFYSYFNGFLTEEILRKTLP